MTSPATNTRVGNAPDLVSPTDARQRGNSLRCGGVRNRARYWSGLALSWLRERVNPDPNQHQQRSSEPAASPNKHKESK